jgi:hypothetical protein
MIGKITKYVVAKLVLYLLCLLIFKDTIGNDNFEISSINNDRVFYNLIKHKSKIFVGTSEGIYQFDLNNELIKYDRSINGVINSNLNKSYVFKIKYINSPVSLPNSYNKTVTDFAINGNNLYVISRGVLFVYKKKAYTFTRYNSVRSISENCVGTYNGVIVNGIKLKKTQYTDGQIKEFGDITFVCFNGLTAVDSNQEKILYWNDNSKSSNAQFGKAENIFSIGNSDYILITSKGIYHYNYILNSFNLIYSSVNKIIPIRNKLHNIQNDNEFHFIDDDKFLTLNTLNFKTSIFQDELKYEIIDILECSFDGSNFYALSKDNLLLNFKKSNDGIQIVNALQLKYPYHTIVDSESLIFLMGNNGLSVYEKTLKKIHYDYINDEFNKNATFKNKGDLSFGSIHGVYKIENVNSLNKSYYLENLNSNDYSNKYSYLVFIVLFIFIITAILMLRTVRKQNLSNEELVVELKKFIKKNLRTVTLASLEEQFNLDYYVLNNLQKDFSPAKYIRQERNLKAKELFQKKMDISKISDLTGYSESYLLRNKHIYLKL